MSNSDDSLPPSGRTLQQAFEALIEVLVDRRVRYAIIGGIAVIQYARVRTTDDIDALLTLPQLGMPGFFETLAARGFEVDVLRNIREFRDDGITSVAYGKVRIDLMRPVLPIYAHVLDRAVSAEILGKQVSISSVEGLIVMKLIAMRPQDEADVRELVAAHQGELDLGFIRTEMESIADEDDPRRSKFETWVREAGGPESNAGR